MCAKSTTSSVFKGRKLVFTGVGTIALLAGVFAGAWIFNHQQSALKAAASGKSAGTATAAPGQGFSADAATGQNTREGSAISLGTRKASTPEEVKALHDGLAAATTYVNSNQDGKADVVLAGLAKKFPGEPQIWRQWYDLRLHQKRPQEALDIMNSLIHGGFEDASVDFNAGMVASMLGKTDESIEHFQRACDLDKTNPQYPLYLAQMYLKKKENLKAEEMLLATIAIDPSIHEAWGTLGQIELIENKLNMAMQHFEHARQLAPEFLLWRIDEAKVLRRQGKPESAITLLGALPENERYLPEVVDEIAQCWALMGSPVKAAQEEISRVNHDPTDWKAALSAARYYLIAKDIESARAWAGIAQRSAPDANEPKEFLKALDKGDRTIEQTETTSASNPTQAVDPGGH